MSRSYNDNAFLPFPWNALLWFSSCLCSLFWNGAYNNNCGTVHSSWEKVFIQFSFGWKNRKRWAVFWFFIRDSGFYSRNYFSFINFKNRQIFYLKFSAGQWMKEFKNFIIVKPLTGIGVSGIHYPASYLFMAGNIKKFDFSIISNITSWYYWLQFCYVRLFTRPSILRKRQQNKKKKIQSKKRSVAFD